MKKNLSIQNSEERNVTTLELTINDHVNTCWIDWDNLNIPRIDAVQFKLNHYKKEQKQTLSFLQNKIKMLQEQLQEETNKLMSLNSIENKLSEVNSTLRDSKNPKGVEIILSSGEITTVDADVLELIDPSDYKLLKVGEIPVAKSNKKASQLAQFHEVNEEFFM
jgi:hypothetical protein